MVNPLVGVRLTQDQLAAIDKLIDSGEFGNRSEFIQYAIRKMLKTFESRTPPLKGGGGKGILIKRFIPCLQRQRRQQQERYL